jgi:hypothetical protein
VLNQGIEMQVPLRYDIVADLDLASYIPNPLTDTEIADEFLKSGTCGAGFIGHHTTLPTTHTGVVWEVSLSLVPPAAIRPLNPKFYNLDTLILQPAKRYKLC